jgi:hypothetical protein
MSPMSKRFPILIAAATLVACATPQRQGPPAPVVSVTQPKSAPPPAAPKPAAPPPVQLYAYRPPGEAATIPEAPAPAPEPESAAAGPPDHAAPGPVTQPEGPPDKVAAAAAAPAPKPPVARPPAPPAPPAPEAAPPAPEVAAAAASPGGQSGPADGLRAQAERQRQTGDYAGAAATLERALRIQPQSALLWNRLARVRTEQGLHSQAANLAAKSNAYAGDQASLRQDNWSIIATARRQAGDVAGAEEAERKARGA